MTLDLGPIKARLGIGVYLHGTSQRSDITALVAEVERLRAAETRVREVHRQGDWIPGTPISGCTGCDDIWESEPCATIRALDGAEVNAK